MHLFLGCLQDLYKAKNISEKEKVRRIICKGEKLHNSDSFLNFNTTNIDRLNKT